jgi:hypothetical protein
MKSYQTNSFELDKKEQPVITDQDHIKGITIHETDYSPIGGFSLTLFPEHIPALLQAVGILLKYATPEQADNTAIALQNLLSGANQIVDAAVVESQASA